ncbi:MAG: hypothetical protein ACREU9_14055, partial [Gammaproteobacteria bacterium]
MRDALQSGFQQGRISDVFSAEILRDLAALGSTATLHVSPTATSVEVRSDAVIGHGMVQVADRTASPRPSFVALRPGGAITRRILHAGGAWAPGAGSMARRRKSRIRASWSPRARRSPGGGRRSRSWRHPATPPAATSEAYAFLT